MVEELASVMGIPRMTMEVTARHLMKDGLISRVKPGQRSEEYGRTDIRNLLLGTTGYQPVDGPKAVLALSTVRATPPNLLAKIGGYNTPSAIQPEMLFIDWLDIRIDNWAVPNEEMLFRLRGQNSLMPSLLVSMSPSIPQVNIHEFIDNVGLTSTLFMPEHNMFRNETPNARRTLEITEAVLAVAGALLADSRAKMAAPQTPSSLPGRSDEDDATPETTKASGTGIHGGLQSQQPTHTREQTAPINKVQFMAQESVVHGSVGWC